MYFINNHTPIYKLDPENINPPTRGDGIYVNWPILNTPSLSISVAMNDPDLYFIIDVDPSPITSVEPVKINLVSDSVYLIIIGASPNPTDAVDINVLPIDILFLPPVIDTNAVDSFVNIIELAVETYKERHGLERDPIENDVSSPLAVNGNIDELKGDGKGTLVNPLPSPLKDPLN